MNEQLLLDEIFNKTSKQLQLQNNLEDFDLKNIINEYQIISDDDIELMDYDDYGLVNENQLNVNDKTLFTGNLDNKLIFFNLDIYLDNIILSYDLDDDKIKNQFFLDFNRSTLYINKQILNYEESCKFLNKYSNYEINIFNNKKQFNQILFMICTQASFAFLFALMSYVYNNSDFGIFVVSNDIEYFIDTTNINNSNNVNNLDDFVSDINITLKAKFNQKNIYDNTIIGEIIITANFDIIFNMNEKNYKFNKYGIISWVYHLSK